MVFRFLYRRRLRRIYSSGVPPELLDELLSPDLGNRDLLALTEGSVEFVIAAVRGSTAQKVSKRMGTVADLALEHGGAVVSLVSSLVIVTFGMPPHSDAQALGRRSYVGDIQVHLGANFKAVHGAAQGHYGNLGSTNRMFYSFIVPGFVEAMAMLFEIRFGEIAEFSTDAPAA